MSLQTANVFLNELVSVKGKSFCRKNCHSFKLLVKLYMSATARRQKQNVNDT